MELNGQAIVTPYDDPSGYSESWRHSIAVAWMNNPRANLAYKYRTDRIISKQRDYLELCNKSPVMAASARLYADNRIVTGWYEDPSDIKYYLEPLLLTEQPLEVIAKDLKAPLSAVQLYSNLFFACRDEYGNPLSSNALRTILSYEAVMANDRGRGDYRLLWRYSAVLLGYHHLAMQWGWFAPNGKLDDAEKRTKFSIKISKEAFMRKIIDGKVDAMTLAVYVHGYDAIDASKKDIGESEVVETLTKVLQIAMPSAQRAMMESRMRELSDAEHNLLLAASNVRATNVVDLGQVGGSARNGRVREKLAKFQGVKT
jgi:hypothetical protein